MNIRFVENLLKMDKRTAKNLLKICWKFPKNHQKLDKNQINIC